MERIMIGELSCMQEILNNVFLPVIGENSECIEVIDNENNKLIKYDIDKMTDRQARLIETLLYSRKADGLLENVYSDNALSQAFEVLDENNKLLVGSFEVGVETESRAKEIIRDVFQPANVYDVHVSSKPIAPGMYNFCKLSLLAVGLSEEQMKMLNRASSVKGVGIKTRQLVNSVTTTGYTSAKIIANDIINPLAECAGKYAGLTASTAVKATYKAGATFADEVLSNITREEFTEYEPAQRAVASFRKLIHGDSGKKKTISCRSL